MRPIPCKNERNFLIIFLCFFSQNAFSVAHHTHYFMILWQFFVGIRVSNSLRKQRKKSTHRQMQPYKHLVSLSILSAQIVQSNVDSDNNNIAMTTMTTITRARIMPMLLRIVAESNNNNNHKRKLFKKRSVKWPGSLSHSLVSEEAFSSKCTKYILT